MISAFNGLCKASSSWFLRWMRDFGVRFYKPSVKIPAKQWKARPLRVLDEMATIQSFRDQMAALEQVYKYPPDLIINMDETPTWLDAPIRRALDLKGTKTVAIKSLEQNQRKRVTTVLTVTQSGRLLDPCIIEPGNSKMAREQPGNTRYTSGNATIYKQPNNTMTSHIMIDWITNVLAPQFPANEKKLIILDSAACHKTLLVKDNKTPPKL